MKKSIIFISLLFSVACTQIDKPKKLISKDEMAEIMVDMAIYAGFVDVIDPEDNMEKYSEYILQKHKINGTIFMESHNYYLSQKELKSIIDLAQRKLRKIDSKLDAYIKVKNKGNEFPK